MNEKELLSVLGTNIKKYRGRLNLSQEQLAAKMDISTIFLSSIERGTKWVSPRTVVRLAEALDIDIYELFKSENILPDDSRSVLNKYAEEVQSAENKIRAKYLQQLKSRQG